VVPFGEAHGRSECPPGQEAPVVRASHADACRLPQRERERERERIYRDDKEIEVVWWCRGYKLRDFYGHHWWDGGKISTGGSPHPVLKSMWHI
jgi:hypothetical protein